LEVFVEGEGTVSASPQGTVCSSSAELCYEYDSSTSVNITAFPAPGYIVASWSPSSCGEANTCRVTVDDDIQVTVTFSPLDTDEDGDSVVDPDDQCPMTSPGLPVDEQGCADNQKDSDGDGVTDNLDLCANTPAGASVNARGCAPFQLDSDGDGVNDALDQCPVTEPGRPV